MAPDPRAFTTSTPTGCSSPTKRDRRPGKGSTSGTRCAAGCGGRRGPTRSPGRTSIARAFEPTFRFDRRWDARSAPFEPRRTPPGRHPGADPERSSGGLARERAATARVGGPLRPGRHAHDRDDRGEGRDRPDPAGGPVRSGPRTCCGRSSGRATSSAWSPTPGRHRRNVLRQHGIEDAFDVLAISELLGTEKPDPRMFRHALAGARAARLARPGTSRWSAIA